MRTLLFLDDWLVDRQADLVRRFGQPSLLREQPDFPGVGYCSVLREPDTGRWRLWYFKPAPPSAPSGGLIWGLAAMESEDGLDWRPLRPEKPTDPLAEWDPDIVLSRHVGSPAVTLDRHDPDPARRYKAPVAAPPGCGAFGRMAYSPDGLNWTLAEDHVWYRDRGRSGPDTLCMGRYNPISRRYQIVCRPACLDRRVAMVESAPEDPSQWDDPWVVLQPDALDEPGLQFYGMPWFAYPEPQGPADSADYFLGLLWRQHVSQWEEQGGVKWLGEVDCELAYSGNGRAWLRTDRQPFIGLDHERVNEAGYLADEQIYPCALVEDGQGSLRFYSGGYSVQHYAAEPPLGVPNRQSLLVHTLRRDGFACLRPRAGWGMLATRCLQPHDADLRLNVRATQGQVLVQVSDAHYRPWPGLSFDDCLPLAGDHLSVPVPWKDADALAKVVSQVRANVNVRVRLEFRLFQAELYAIHWHTDLGYGDTDVVIPNLA